MALSVVIPTHNRGGRIEPVIRAALADTATSELVVVLDGCTDGTAALIHALEEEDPRVVDIILPANMGQQEATVVGVRAATAPMVLCVDDDVQVAPGCIDGHARHHADGDADVVVGSMPVAPGSHDLTQARYAAIYESHAREWTEDPSTLLRTLWGGNVSCGREQYLEAASRCDLSLRFHQDQELGFAFARMGLTALFDPSLAAVHLYEREVEAVMRDVRRAGDAYATLLRRYADLLPPWRETFAPELEHVSRRTLVRLVSDRRAQEPLTRLCRSLSRRRWAVPAASILLQVLLRGEYYRGFFESPHRAAAVTS